MRKSLITCTLIGLISSMGWSGVVIEMEESDPGGPEGAPVDTIYAQDEMLRMDSRDDENGRTSFIFRDDALWMVSHEEKSCQMIDRQAMERLSDQLGGVMKQMEAELAKLPPEQRAMMEEMMKGRMSAAMGAGGAAGPPRRVETGAVESIGEYSCTIQTLYAGDDKVWEVCAASENDLPGAASEAMAAFRAMSRFAEQLRDTLQQGPLADMFSTPFSELNEVNGMPIRVRSYERGRLANESTLKSIVSKDLEAGMFDVPDGYTVNNLGDEMNRSR